MSFYKVPFGANNRYKYATVPANSTMTIYVFTNWGNDFIAFIDKIGFGPDCLPWDLIRFIWEIDGEVVEVFNYQLAGVRKPKQFYEEPYIAKKQIVWKVINDDVEPHVCEVLCDGLLVMKPQAKVRYNV